MRAAHEADHVQLVGYVSWSLSGASFLPAPTADLVLVSHHTLNTPHGVSTALILGSSWGGKYN